MSITRPIKETRAIPIGFTIVSPWDKSAEMCVFQRASIQYGSVETGTNDYVGSRGNEPVAVDKLSDECRGYMVEIDRMLRAINEQVVNDYPNYVEPKE